jgi:hypothetical protein
MQGTVGRPSKLHAVCMPSPPPSHVLSSSDSLVGGSCCGFKPFDCRVPDFPGLPLAMFTGNIGTWHIITKSPLEWFQYREHASTHVFKSCRWPLQQCRPFSPSSPFCTISSSPAVSFDTFTCPTEVQLYAPPKCLPSELLSLSKPMVHGLRCARGLVNCPWPIFPNSERCLVLQVQSLVV